MTVRERRARLLQWLRDEPWLPVATLAERLGVSRMTVHRDVAALERAGLLRREWGAVRAAGPAAGAGPCAVCGRPVPEVGGWRLAEAAPPLRFCCGHCAQLYRAAHPDGVLLAYDPLWGRVGDITEGWLVEGSRITPCCQPSVFWFAEAATAQAFVQAFGGRLVRGRGEVAPGRADADSG